MHQADFVLQRARAQASLDFLDRELAALEILGEQRLVALGGSLDHLGAPLLALFEHAARDIAIFELHALGFVVPPNRLHLDEIDHAHETIFGADGQLNRYRVASQAGTDLLDAAQEIRAGAVHFVDERNPRHTVLIHLTPDGLGLRLHPDTAQ